MIKKTKPKLTMNKLANIAPLAILMVIISITLAPLSTHGGRIGWHSLMMAKSLAMFCAGSWMSEYLRNRLNRKRIIGVAIIAGVCVIQYLALEIAFYISDAQAYEWRHIALVSKYIYFTTFLLLGVVMNASWSKRLVDPCGVEVVAYPFRNPVLAQVKQANNKVFLNNCCWVAMCFVLYMILKLFPEMFYYATSEGVGMASRTLAIIPWCGTLISLYRCCTSNVAINLTNKSPKIAQSVSSMLPAAILLMLPMHHLGTIMWWVDLIRYPIYLVITGLVIRFAVCLCKILTSERFDWKYVFLGYK